MFAAPINPVGLPAHISSPAVRPAEASKGAREQERRGRRQPSQEQERGLDHDEPVPQFTYSATGEKAAIMPPAHAAPNELPDQETTRNSRKRSLQAYRLFLAAPETNSGVK